MTYRRSNRRAAFAVLAAALASQLLPSAAWAKDPVFVETRHVPDRPSVTLEPTKAYVLVESNVQIPFLLMRIPDADDQAIYDRLRAEALADAIDDYPGKLSYYQSQLRIATARSPSGGKSRHPLPERPVEPTDANFAFTPFGMMAKAVFGPTNRFAKGEGGHSVYLQGLTPGRYFLYGFFDPALGGQMCFCMGTISFEARAGEVVNLGRFEVASLLPAIGEAGVVLRPATADAVVDPRLSGATVRPAIYRPVGKQPNVFGIRIGRFPAMDGVMRYDRDWIVDLTGSTEVAAAD